MPGLAVWEPTLDGVARHIPRRTRDASTPGKDKTLGTFTETTTPTSGQAQEDVDAAVRSLLALVGTVPANANLEAKAREVAEWRAAADIELHYPNRDADVAVAAQLDARARTALAELRTALAEVDSGPVSVTPQWAFPDPPPWGDRDL